MRQLPPYKTWIEISRNAVKNNVRTFRSILRGKTKLFAVVKSNAYGHGLETFSALADEFGVDGFCVDSVIEGQKLRQIGIKKKILVLGPTFPEMLKKAAETNLTITVSNFEILRALKKSKQPVTFHLKIDTGMHRQGFYHNDLLKVIKEILNSKFEMRNYLEGVYTHFAAAKDVTYPDYTLRQLRIFRSAQNIFRQAGFKQIIFHAAASGGTLLYPQAQLDLVRVGIGLYGYWPSYEAKLQHSQIWKKELEFHPVLSWRARVSETKSIKAGEFIGYDLSERAYHSLKTAIIPIGYWHGFPRALSSRGEVLIGGRRSKVLGRVSMDLITVELAAAPRGVDTATLIGTDRFERITVDEAALRAGTTSYEFLTRINPLIKRIVV